MPSISQAEHDRLHSEIRTQRTMTAALQQENVDLAADRKRLIDDLQRVLDAAEGRAVDGSDAGHWASAMGELVRDDRLTDVEKVERQLRYERDQVASLECRLAAVRAVAQMARAHSGPSPSGTYPSGR